MTFAETLRNTRTAARVSMGQLGRSSGYSRSYISRLEDDLRHPTRGTVMQIAAALNCTSLERDRLLVSAGYLPASLWMRARIEEMVNA